MWERIFVILRKEFIQALREPRMRVLLFVPPMVQLIVFGFAVNLEQILKRCVFKFNCHSH